MALTGSEAELSAASPPSTHPVVRPCEKLLTLRSLCPLLVPGGQGSASFSVVHSRLLSALCSLVTIVLLGPLTASHPPPACGGPEGSGELLAAGARLLAAPGAVCGPAALRLSAEAACPTGMEAAPQPVPPQVLRVTGGLGVPAAPGHPCAQHSLHNSAGVTKDTEARFCPRPPPGTTWKTEPFPGAPCAPCAWSSAGTPRPHPVATCSAGSASRSGVTPRWALQSQLVYGPAQGVATVRETAFKASSSVGGARQLFGSSQVSQTGAVPGQGAILAP